MKIFKPILLIAFLFTINNNIFAQANFSRANAMFDKLSYSSVIPVYLAAMKNEKTAEGASKLAYCYRMINDQKNAENWYSEALKLNGVLPINNLYYAEALMANEKYAEARVALENYMAANGTEKRAKNLLDACKNIKNFQQQNSAYELFQLPYPINSSNSEIGPAIYEGQLVYSSDRDSLVVRNNHTWTGRTFYDIYSATKTGDVNEAKYGKPGRVKSKNTLTRFHEGPVSFSKDNSKMIITRNNFSKTEGIGKDENGTVKLKLYEAKVVNNKWNTDEGATFVFNSDAYNTAHPALNQDDTKLFFSSDMPGGYGGMDLYVATRSGNTYTNPINLGPAINTEGDEVFPFVDNNGTLYFSSNGLPSMGGLDIFSADGEGANWSGVANLGAPINSNKDDFGYVVDDNGEFGYIASNRNETKVGDDDIYSFKCCVIKMNGIVVDKNTDEPIGNATVKLEEFGKGLGTVTTAANGKFTYNVSCDRDYKICGMKDGYGDAVCKNVKSGSNSKIPLFVKIPLESMGEPCQLFGFVTNKKTGEPIPNTSIKIQSVYGSKYITTDDRGMFKDEGVSNTEYTLVAQKEGFFDDTKKAKLGDCANATATNLKLGFEMQPIEVSNDLVTINNIYYDFNKYYIRPDAAVELDKVLDLMNRNPTLQIELGSHTDCRASMSYNKTLSENRAKAAVNYLITNGISRSRVTAKGYGETELYNNCPCEPTNNSNCSDDEHQANRRTTIKVLGYKGGELNGKNKY
jgi:outer membrane protein OmpA-like peptidoglycan-associated protein